VYDLATSSWRAVTGQENLTFGDRIRTGAGGLASLEYTNEQVALRIKAGSTCQVLDRQTLRVFAGNAWVRVRRKGTAFRTETPNAIASVRGTKYSVEVTPITDVYRESGMASVQDFIARHQGARSTTDLTLYSAHMGLAIMRRMADESLPGRVVSEVKVYESVVDVIARNEQGGEAARIQLHEGFKTRVMLAALSQPAVLTEDDLLEWKSVMPLDTDLLTRARARGATGAASGGARPGATGSAPEGPAGGVRPPAGPVSETGRPQTFEDIHRR
jgi:hypothetical protein